MMMKTLTAGVLSLSLALTSVTATPAQAEISESDAIVGILTLLLIGSALADAKDDNDDRDRRPNRRDQWRVLPAECLVTVNTRRHDQVRMFGRRCLINNYDHVQRLPERCEISVRSRRGHMRHGYAPRCLRHAGFRMEGGRRR